MRPCLSRVRFPSCLHWCLAFAPASSVRRRPNCALLPGARKRAKEETGAIVLLLKFDIDSFQKGTYILNSPDMDVDVVSFAPGTGQEKFKGKVYYKAQAGPNVRKDNWPGGTPIKITAEAVGVEAAEQVHDWLLLEELRRKNP